MLARLQKVIVAFVIAMASVWGYHFVSRDRPGLAVAGAALILFGYALFLGLEFIAVYKVQRSEAGPYATGRQLLSAWWGEVFCAPRVFCWRQPFRSQAEPDFIPADSGGRTGVVLVHGFVCNRGLWTPWMRDFRERGIPFVAVNLEPVFGSIDDYPQIIEVAVARIEMATAMPVVLVGHSMGGLAIRSWLTKFRADQRVRHVITIGTPHQGTWLARYSTTVNGAQMRPGSPWLTNLAGGEPTTGRPGLFTCFYSDCDNIVFPARMGTIPGAVNHRLSGVAHMEMVFERPVIQEVLQWLEAPGKAVQI